MSELGENSGVDSGIFEFVFGRLEEEQDDALAYWAELGFNPAAEGSLTASDASALYGHESDVKSIRLEHSGCEAARGGYVRLQFWETLRNEGLGTSKPMDIGSLWMGLYTKDILSAHDAYGDQAANHDAPGTISPIVRAALEWPEPEFGYYRRFVGLRELVLLAPDYRQAFIQRAGFDRPGFGTFDPDTPLLNTEGTHGNIVQPTGEFSSEFYKSVFKMETAPFGEADDAGDKPSTIAVFELSEGQMFRIERLKSPNSPSGLLQVYSPHYDSPDKRDLARPGSRGLCCYSYTSKNVSALASAAKKAGASQVSETLKDEFGNDSASFDAPDGIRWVITSNDS